MKFLKKMIIFIICCVLIIILLLLLDIFHFVVLYQFQRRNYQDSIPVLGNTNHYVPQGLAYSEKYDVVLQTSYNSDHKVSMLYVTDFSSGKVLKKLKLKEIDQSDSLHHVGGVATDDRTVWITSDYEVNEYSLHNILNTNDGYIQSSKNHKLPIRGDFCTFHDNILWIGDFCLKPFYPVPDDNPLLLGYSNWNDYDKPEVILSLPKMVQGLTFNDKNQFVFTTSFTNLIPSNFLIYDNILENKSNEIYTLKGREIPYYVFLKKDLVEKVHMPPMAEGLFFKDSSYYILFENSSDHYFYAFPKLKNIIQYKK